MQRLRGTLYLADGAIGAEHLSHDGRHILPTDDQSWHLLTLGDSGEVLGCTRYLQHGAGTRFDDLGISKGPLASSDIWGVKMRAAVEEDLWTARKSGFSYVEVGGWAMAPRVRCTAECLRSVLATYAWSRLIGGAIGISTATERNGSASILRRLGGSLVNWAGAEIPPYYDPRYDCRMHMLRYDSRKPNPRYEDSIEHIRHTLAEIPVICPERPSRQRMFSGFAARAGLSRM
ncbi:MAG: hypothetical protein M3N54_12895, partial [Acidobacteriota bacterium]|nr:hypothetical protein [Acidobacteriota bacterium]